MDSRNLDAFQSPQQPLPNGEEILRVENLTKNFPVRRGPLRRQVHYVHAVDNISLSVAAGETLALVGESGCGKSTVARMLVRLIDPTSGRIFFKSQDITHLSRRQMRTRRQEIQMVFQDPYASLNPRMTVHSIIAEPLRAHGRYSKARVDELLEQVGLDRDNGRRFPSEFSGGQRQRIGIARALTLNPQLLVLDEPTSALDVSIRAQVVNLLAELQKDLGLAYLFISHDLSTIRHVSDRVAVMYLGRIVETGTHKQVYQQPLHPYTQALLSAVPIPDPSLRGKDRVILEGELPNPANPPSGCRFRTRCWKAQDICAAEAPSLTSRGEWERNHPSACHFAEPRYPSPTAPSR